MTPAVSCFLFPATMNYREDCRHYNGEKPCRFKCEGGCRHFEPFGTRILVLKLGAIGDVLRTTPILRVLKKLHPTSHITWLVEDLGAPLLKNNPLIDKVLTPSFGTTARLQVEKFDEMYCLDKVDLATGMAMMVKATKKFGFAMNEFGTMTTFSPQGEYARTLGLSDNEKFFVNQKPYQQIIFESLGWEYSREDHEYVFELDEKEIAWANEFAAAHALNTSAWSTPDARAPIIGINTGAGNVFAGKAWRIARIAELCRRLHSEMNAKVLLLGGPSERARNLEILALAEGAAVDTGTDNPLPRFAALVNLCDAIVSGDTTCMHLAIALKKRTIIFFGATCAQEIDLYGRGEKIVSPIPCAPCYLKAGTCPIGEACMDTIHVDDIYSAIQRQLSAARVPSP